MYAVSDIIEDINITPLKKVVKKKDPPEKSGFSFYLNRQENLPREIKLPDEQQELPVDEWIMPDQPHSYIKGRDKDLL
jgi:hypothetical protein